MFRRIFNGRWRYRQLKLNSRKSASRLLSLSTSQICAFSAFIPTTNKESAPGSRDDVEVYKINNTNSLTNESMNVASPMDNNQMQESKNSTTVKSELPLRTKVKPKVIRIHQDGIYTIKTFKSSDFLAEWYKGLRVSSPYIFRLLKIYWSLSPTRFSTLLIASIAKALLPSCSLWVTKQFLDHVQSAAIRKSVQWKAMLLLAFLSVGIRITVQGLDVLSYSIVFLGEFLTIGMRLAALWKPD